MKLSLGIVGLPNVGKSTLFNALTNNNIPAENFPFTTIDPNIGVVPVMDPRLDRLAELVNPAKVTPAIIEFYDIAGLIKGASQGEGLGNQFLANIRNVNAIIHVVRAFKNPNILHVETDVDPRRDIELINTELIIKDLDTVTNKINAMKGMVRANPKLQEQATWMENLMQHLESGKLAFDFDKQQVKDDIIELRKSLFLLTDKPVLYLVNTEESTAEENTKLIREYVGLDKEVIGLDNQLEFEISTLDASEKAEYLKELGLGEPGLAKLTRAAYNLLGLISYFTAGEKEVRAWTIESGDSAPKASGAIHTDFEKKFIAADVVTYDDFVDTGGWQAAKAAGKVRLEGKNYIVKDGDVVLFRIGA